MPSGRPCATTSSRLAGTMTACLIWKLVTATSRAQAAHGELLVWLREITGVSGIDNAPRLLKGFCQ